jgi:ParB family transcriptional regulator, chromosome partitioning protein
MSAKNVEIVAQSGTERFIPLNNFKKSSNNARKTPHGEASTEACAASIAAKGILHNLVVEPEMDADGAATGFYFVTIGKGRRLASFCASSARRSRRTNRSAA